VGQSRSPILASTPALHARSSRSSFWKEWPIRSKKSSARPSLPTASWRRFAIDEVDFGQLGQAEASPLFRLVSYRYGRASIPFVTNKLHQGLAGDAWPATTKSPSALSACPFPSALTDASSPLALVQPES
jgi:hypothetical protein